MQTLVKALRNKRLYIASLLVTCLSLNIVSATAPEGSPTKNLPQLNNAYTTLAQLHLPSLTQQEMKEQEEAKQVTEHNKNLKPTDTKNVRIKNLGEVEKLRILYNIFAHHEGYVAEQNNILNSNVFNDLEIYCGNKSNLDHHLFTVLDQTESMMGKIQLQKMFFEPTADVTELKRRQRIVQTLLNNEALFNSLDEKVKAIKSAETDFVSFWRELEEEATKFFDIAYFQKSWLGLQKFNKNETLLETLSLHRTIGSPAFAIASPLIQTYIIWFVCTTALLWIKNNVEKDDQYKAPVPESFQSFSAYLSENGRTIRAFITNQEIGVGRKALLSVPVAAMLFFYVRGISQSLEIAETNNKITNLLHGKMINVATLTNNVRFIAQTILSHEKLAQDIPSIEAVRKAFTSMENPQTTALLNSLKADTFKGAPRFLSHRGKVLATFKTMYDANNGFVASMKAAGEVDAYLSIAKLYKKLAKNTNAQYCFVEYANNITPYAKITNFWHPILNPDRVVTNNIELGAPEKARNVILTGPNAGGKSTSLKGITLAIIMAQTVGIAPASEMTLTPFTLINTYLNIADSEGKESLFQAEMRRAHNLLNAIKKLHNTEFSFVIMDEIFTGTNPKEGMAGAYGVAKKLSTYPNNMGVIATHFQVLTDLEKDTKGLFVNKKVSVIKDGGRITYPYKLENGISDQAIALELLQADGFDSEILQDAYNVMHNKPQAQQDGSRHGAATAV